MSAQPGWPETPLSAILKLRSTDAHAAARALGRVLGLYCQPIRAFVERRVPADLRANVDDWTQAFMVKFIESSLTAGWNPQIGHLRHYVARSLHNFIRDQLRALARHPELPLAPADMPEGAVDADADFHREWAELVVTRAFRRLEAVAAGKTDYEQDIRLLRLRYGIGEEHGPLSYEQISIQLGRSLARHQIDNSLRRARREFMEALRDEVRLLMHSDAGIDPELWRLAELLEAKASQGRAT